MDISYPPGLRPLPQYRHYTGLSADRLYRILYRRVTCPWSKLSAADVKLVNKLMSGGYQPWGYDWATLRTCHPQIGRVMAEIDQLYRDDTT